MVRNDPLSPSSSSPPSRSSVQGSSCAGPSNSSSGGGSQGAAGGTSMGMGSSLAPGGAVEEDAGDGEWGWRAEGWGRGDVCGSMP